MKHLFLLVSLIIGFSYITQVHAQCSISIDSVYNVSCISGSGVHEISVAFTSAGASNYEVLLGQNIVGTGTSSPIEGIFIINNRGNTIVVRSALDPSCFASATYPNPPCSINNTSCYMTNIHATTPICNSGQVQFEISGVISNGSGLYRIEDRVTNNTIITSSIFPISISLNNQSAGLRNWRILDVNDPINCVHNFSFNMPDCQMSSACSIANVTTTNFICNGNQLTFDVQFVANNSSGSFNVRDDQGALLGSGTASPISIALTNTTAGTLGITVEDSNELTCSETFTTDIPDCPQMPDCSITNVTAINFVCVGNQLSFDVEFMTSNTSGSYNVLDGQGVILGSGITSPISIALTNTTAGPLDITVVDSNDPSCRETFTSDIPDCRANIIPTIEEWGIIILGILLLIISTLAFSQTNKKSKVISLK